MISCMCKEDIFPTGSIAGCGLLPVVIGYTADLLNVRTTPCSWP